MHQRHKGFHVSTGATAYFSPSSLCPLGTLVRPRPSNNPLRVVNVAQLVRAFPHVLLAMRCLAPRYQVRTLMGKPPQYKVCSSPLTSLRKQRFFNVFFYIILQFFVTTRFISDGMLFSWGMNEHGQLGLGNFSPKVETPQRITCLHGLPVRQISAGGFHSFFLSKSGALFGCGKNS